MLKLFRKDSLTPQSAIVYSGYDTNLSNIRKRYL